MIVLHDYQDSTPDSETSLVPRLWNRDEYYHMAEAGILGPDERLELINGEITLNHTNGDPRLFNRDEYYRMAEAGILGADERVELIDGKVIADMSPIGAPHSWAADGLQGALREAFGDKYCVFVKRPITLAYKTEPQPDVVVAVGSRQDYRTRHPSPADIRVVVEVSDSTLAAYRTIKAALYAAAGIPEYWVLNLIDSRLEVFRKPHPDTGYAYAAIHLAEDSVSPLEAPNAVISVKEILP